DAEQVAPQRVVEDVEPDVHLELWILDPERLGVAEEHPVLPLALPGEAGEEADDPAEYGDPGAQPWPDDHPVPLERGLLRRVGPQQWSQPEGEVEVGADDQGYRQA